MQTQIQNHEDYVNCHVDCVYSPSKSDIISIDDLFMHWSMYSFPSEKIGQDPDKDDNGAVGNGEKKWG